MVGFTSENFIGSESSTFIEVVVQLNEASNVSITVTVTPSEQSSVSANGKGTLTTIIQYMINYTPIGSGVDFNSNPIDITIKAGAMNSSGNISVTCDNEMEGTETFDIVLKLKGDNAPVRLGRSKSIGEIKDSTGSCYSSCIII